MPQFSFTTLLSLRSGIFFSLVLTFFWLPLANSSGTNALI
jgi:hypothetical protein